MAYESRMSVEQAEKNEKNAAEDAALGEKLLANVRTLIEHGADVNRANGAGLTAVALACKLDRLEEELVDVLLEAAGTSFDRVAKDGSSPFSHALRKGHTTLAAKFAAAKAIPPIHHLCWKGDLTALKLLFNVMNNDPEGNEIEVASGLPPLKVGRKALVNTVPNMSLIAGVHDTYCDSCYNNPIVGRKWQCVDCGYTDYCDSCYEVYLGQRKSPPQAGYENHNLNHNFAPQPINSDSEVVNHSPLTMLCAGGDDDDDAGRKQRAEIASLLILYGAEVNHTIKSKDSALTLACARAHVNNDLVGELLKAGADVNHRNAVLDTPLILATRRSAVSAVTVTLLLEKRASLSAANKAKETPLSLICNNEGIDPSVVLVVMERGDEQSATDYLVELLRVKFNHYFHAIQDLEIETGATVVSRVRRTMKHQLNRAGLQCFSATLDSLRPKEGGGGKKSRKAKKKGAAAASAQSAAVKGGDNIMILQQLVESIVTYLNEPRTVSSIKSAARQRQWGIHDLDPGWLTTLLVQALDTRELFIAMINTFSFSPSFEAFLMRIRDADVTALENELEQLDKASTVDPAQRAALVEDLRDAMIAAKENALEALARHVSITRSLMNHIVADAMSTVFGGVFGDVRIALDAVRGMESVNELVSKYVNKRNKRKGGGGKGGKGKGKKGKGKKGKAAAAAAMADGVEAALSAFAADDRPSIEFSDAAIAAINLAVAPAKDLFSELVSVPLSLGNYRIFAANLCSRLARALTSHLAVEFEAMEVAVAAAATAAASEAADSVADLPGSPLPGTRSSRRSSVGSQQGLAATQSIRVAAAKRITRVADVAGTAAAAFRPMNAEFLGLADSELTEAWSILLDTFMASHVRQSIIMIEVLRSILDRLATKNLWGGLLAELRAMNGRSLPSGHPARELVAIVARHMSRLDPEVELTSPNQQRKLIDTLYGMLTAPGSLTHLELDVVSDFWLSSVSTQRLLIDVYMYLSSVDPTNLDRSLDTKVCFVSL